MNTIAEKEDLRILQEQINAIYDKLDCFVIRQITTHGIVPKLADKRLFEGQLPAYVVSENEEIRNKFK